MRYFGKDCKLYGSQIDILKDMKGNEEHLKLSQMASGYFLCEISGFFKDKFNDDIEQYGVVIDEEQDPLSEDSQNAVTMMGKFSSSAIKTCEERSRSSSRER